MKTTYYVAVSLDGYIAGPQGELDWLPMDQDYGFHEFLASVDGVVMGARTYEFIQNHGKWPYGGLRGWVFTHDPGDPAFPQVQFASSDPRAVVDSIAEAGVEHLWLVGGGELARSFLEADVLDEWRLFVIPVLLGGGVPLVAETAAGDRKGLQMTDTRTFENGVVEIRYRRKAGK